MALKLSDGFKTVWMALKWSRSCELVCNVYIYIVCIMGYFIDWIALYELNSHCDSYVSNQKMCINITMHKLTSEFGLYEDG